MTRVDALEARLETNVSRIDAHDAEIADLIARVVALESRST